MRVVYQIIGLPQIYGYHDNNVEQYLDSSSQLCAIPLAPYWLIPTPCPYPFVVMVMESPSRTHRKSVERRSSFSLISRPENVLSAICTVATLLPEVLLVIFPTSF